MATGVARRLDCHSAHYSHRVVGEFGWVSVFRKIAFARWWVEGGDAIQGPKSFRASVSKEEVRISLKKYRKIPRMRHGSKPKNNDHEI
jgi:hypothetical protein